MYEITIYTKTGEKNPFNFNKPTDFIIKENKMITKSGIVYNFKENVRMVRGRWKK